MRLCLRSVAIVIAGLSLSPVIRAQGYMAAGQRCRPEAGATSFEYYDFGISRNGTSGTNAICPVDYPNPVDVSDAYVYFHDENDTSGANFKCRVVAWNPSGNFTSSWRYGCSTAGGCASDPGVFWQADSFIYWADPLNGGTSLTAWSLSFDCVVPDFGHHGQSYIYQYGICNDC